MEGELNPRMMTVKTNFYKLEQNIGKQIMERQIKKQMKEQLKEQIRHSRQILQRTIGIPQKLETAIIRTLEQQTQVK